MAREKIAATDDVDTSTLETENSTVDFQWISTEGARAALLELNPHLSIPVDATREVLIQFIQGSLNGEY